MRKADPQVIGQCVYDGIRSCAITLREDVRDAIGREIASKEATGETTDRSYAVLQSVMDNASIGAKDSVPICQDTGSVWVKLEIGPDIIATGDVFSCVDDQVAAAYEDGRLRMSIVADALFDRTNTKTNTPAFCDLKPSSVPGARLSLMLKGGGSDNASRVVMLAPGVGRQGIVDAVIDCIREKATNACPPLIIGIGIGGTFDKVASLAKSALLRPVDEPAKHVEVAAFERELLEAVNATGIGPAGLGGFPTALAANVETAPCHIAALPLAINMGCSAMRSMTMDITDLLPECTL